jgi:hypothetical protein
MFHNFALSMFGEVCFVASAQLRILSTEQAAERHTSKLENTGIT